MSHSHIFLAKHFFHWGFKILIISFSPYGNENPCNLTQLAIFLFLLKDELNEYAYDAELAGISYSINATFYGILVSSIDYMFFYTPSLGEKESYEINTVSQSVGQSDSNNFFSETSDRIFMKSYGIWGCGSLKIKQWQSRNFRGKLHFGKKL